MLFRSLPPRNRPSSSATAAKSAASTVATKEETPKAGNGVELITTPDGELMGFSISPAQQLYTMVDRLTGMQRIVALPIAERFALAGKVAAVPDEHKRLVEKLASTVATSMTESGALNALYLLEACRELVPGFKELVPEGRLEQAAKVRQEPSPGQAAELLFTFVDAATGDPVELAQFEITFYDLDTGTDGSSVESFTIGGMDHVTLEPNTELKHSKNDHAWFQQL